MFQILPKCLFFPSLILFTEILFFPTGSHMEKASSREWQGSKGSVKVKETKQNSEKP